MYDKSKKTWSQRLKIHKNEKSAEANATRNINNNSTASITTTTPTKTSVNNLQFPIEAGVLTTTKNPHRIVYEASALNVAHNVNIVGNSNSSSNNSSRVSMPQYQIAAPATVMHLPSPLGDYHASGAVGSQAYEYIPAHMGRSVKYAEPWIYGTVRGIPARRTSNYHPAYVPYMGHPHAATIFTATSSNEMSPTVAAATPAVAVVLCSCPEYLSGTKGRTLKKPSICKKCKGTRLPLHNIGGTLRLPCNIPGPKLRPVGNAQTMRVVSTTKKLRPTILDPQKDPYDLMRRTRLLSPEPGALATGSSTGNPGSSGSSSGKEKSRQRGKSASPVRGRSRTRHHKLLISGNSNSSKETLKALESFDDNWLTESEDLAALTASSKAATNNRKSILRCNVNPYDLISINNHTSAVDSPMTTKEGNRKSNRNQKLKFSQNEFMPPNDDFNVQDAALSEEDPPFLLRNQKTKEDSVKPESNKKLIEEPPPPSSPLSLAQTQTQTASANVNEKGQSKNFNYVNVQAIAGQRISLGEEQQVRKPQLQQSADGTTTTYENFSVETETQVTSKDLEKSSKPRPDSLQVTLGEPKRPPRIGKQQQQTATHEDKESPNNAKDLLLEDEDDLKVTVTVTPTYNIKSILKRPTSKVSENGDTQSNEDTHKNVPTATSKQKDPTNSSKSSTPTNSRRNQTSPATPTANSQFYIPLPQARKKVQFLVEEYENTGSEDPDEDDDDDDEEDGVDVYDMDNYYENRSISSSPSELKVNYEYYNKKRHLQQLQALDNNPTIQDSDTEVVTYDEQFIQAMLLEKLQLDSEMVSKRFNETQLSVAENYDKPTTTKITTTTTTTATTIVNKTDNEAEISNGSQRQQQLENQKNFAADDNDENQNENENDDGNDKHYFNENPSNDTKTSLSLSTTSLMAVLNNSATTIEGAAVGASTSLNCNVSLKSTTAMHMNSEEDDDDVYRRKTDDTDYSNGNGNSNDVCLSSNDDNNTSNSNDNNEKNDNIIIIQGLKECDNNTNNNSNNNSRSNSNIDNDNDYGQQQQHLSRNIGNKPTTCHHHSDNNHHHHHHHAQHIQQLQQQQQQLDNVDIIDEDGDGTGDGDGNDVDNYKVNVTTPSTLSFSSASSTQPVSKVQQNGAKKSTTSDYDDDAKTKQQQQKQQQQHQQQNVKQEKKKNFKKDMKQETLAAIAADSSSSNTTSSSCSSSSSGSCGGSNNNDSVSKNGSRKPTKETQSRNPIRRSQSERQLATATAPTTSITAASAIGKTATTYRNNNHKKKKDFTDVHVVAAADNGDGNSGGCNENIISNTRNSLKDLENIPKTTINDRRSATDCSTTTSSTEGNRTTGRARGMSSKTSLHFHDTMALRNRYNRNDSRDLFQTTTMQLIERPREPPPPPPPQATTLTILPQTCLETTLTAVDKGNASTTVPPPLSNSLSKAEDLKEPTKAITLATDAIETVQQQQQQQNLNGLANSNKQQIEQKLTITQATAAYKENVEKINETSRIEDAYQQQMVDITKTSAQRANKEKINMDLASPNSTPTSPLPTTTIWPTTIGHNRHNQQQHQQQPQRTVVRVAPFNKNSSEIHRLKISHTDNNETISTTPSPSGSFCNSSHYSVTDLSQLNGSGCHDYGQKKTSILINGDDCYSTMNLSCDDAGTPLYQSSVVVTDGSCKVNDNDFQGLRVTNTYNTVTINVSSPRSSEDELIQQHNQLNNLLKRQAKSTTGTGSIRAIIPIRGTIDINLQRSASSTSSTSTSSMTSSCSSNSSSSGINISKRGKTLIRLDYDKEKSPSTEAKISSTLINEQTPEEEETNIEEWLPHEAELLKILRNPVEAVKRNLVPHICKLRETDTQKDSKRSKKMKERHADILETSITSSTSSNSTAKTPEMPSFIGKLLEDPMLQQVAEGLETDTVAELIENSLKRLQESRHSLDMSGTKDNEDMNRLIDLSLKRIQEERNSALKDSATTTCHNSNLLSVPSAKDDERLSNRGSISSANSFASAHNYELFDFEANESDCYQSCSSDINSIIEEDVSPSPNTKTKFYQMLVDATLQEIELSTNVEDLNNEEHQYESIRHHTDPIYEEISDVPPPLPLTAPPLNDPELEKKSARSIFEGASKYDILSYLVDAKERGLVKEESFDYPPLNCSNPIIIEEESADTLTDLSKLNKLKRIDTISSRSSIMSDSSDDNQSTMSSLSPPTSNNFMLLRPKQATSDIERNDSGVGSETSKTSRSKFLNPSATSNSSTAALSSSPLTVGGGGAHSQPRSSPLHLCEDCDGPVETQIGENGHIFAPLVCRKCGKKRVERKEIITEVVETEEKYGRDLQIILEEFCHPMLVAGLLTQEQLSAIFLNTEELLENNQTLAERMRDALDIALEQGDDDLLTVNIGKIFLESTQMLHAFESYCVRQAGASLLLANLEKEKELLRIFLKVSQMENAVLRRMNLNSFLMVPVQRVTKYPLLLARLYKVTPSHLEGREQLKQAQEKIELHLNHINQEAKDVPTKLWRRISSSSPSRRASCEIDMINIKLRKMAIDVLEWNHDEVRFVMEGKLLYTQPTDSNWKKARTIKLTTVNALLVTNGKPSTNYKAEKVMSDKLNFPKHTGIREASLLVVKEKCGRYTLIREPLYLDRCVVCSEADWDEYFEIQEISSKDTFIFKAEDNIRTKQWYTQLQYHAQGMGAWRKRRNALANIMINGMLTRS